MHKVDGTTTIFKSSKKGLFFTDIKNNGGSFGHLLINTVDKIKYKYTFKECSHAVCAHSIQDIIGRPSTKNYI